MRILFVAGGLMFFLLAVGFFLQAPAATRLWPWPDSRLSYVFLASIAAAVGAPMIWIGLAGEYAAARPGAMNLGLMAAGMAAYLFGRYLQESALQLLYTALALTACVPLNAGIYLWSRRYPARDRRPTPRPVWASFIIFAGLLVLVGGALALRAPNIFPWPLNPDSSVLFGLIFLGAAVYFVFGLLQKRWAFARGQLLGFLAYDLVLIVPFLAHFAAVKPDHRLSLYVYTGVLVFSGLLAGYYLFLNRGTRAW